LQGKKHESASSKSKDIGCHFYSLNYFHILWFIFYLQSATEQNVRHSIFEQQRQNQLKDREALSKHIGTDLSLVVDNLRGLANSLYVQQGDLSQSKTKKLPEET
jgi:hypothetical protein